MTKITMITISVNRIASLREGQDTFRNSPIVSWKNRWILNQNRWKKFISCRADFKSGTVIPPVMVKTPPLADGVIQISLQTIYQAGQVGIEPTTPAFGERCSAKLSYWPVLGLANARPYFVSRCSVCLRQRGQNLFNSIRPGSLRLFFSVV